MIGDRKNNLKIIDESNEETHCVSFDEQTELYDGEIFIIDTREMGFEIASELMQRADDYDWDEIERDDITLAITSWLLEVRDKLYDRVEEVLDENNIEHEVL